MLLHSFLVTCMATIRKFLSLIPSKFWSRANFKFLPKTHPCIISFEIGLFGLIGLAGVAAGPFLGKLIDSIVTWGGVLIGIVVLGVGFGIFTGAVGISVAAFVVVVFSASSFCLSLLTEQLIFDLFWDFVFVSLGFRDSILAD